MTSAIRIIFGLSVLALTAGCSSSSPSSPTVVPGGGSGNTGGAPGGGGAGGDTSGLPPGTPLLPTNGWIDASMSVGIQGAVFSYADTVSAAGPPMLATDVTGPRICIQGVAAKVIMPCTIVMPATDCYGTYWGAALGENLNQPIDMATGMGVTTPLSYDASALKGFAFDVDATGISGTMATIPVASAFRFNAEDGATQYCTPTAKAIKPGPNTMLFTDLHTMCYAATMGPSADTAKAHLTKISWQVVTNTTSTVPFDFCISNIRALPN